MYYYLSFLRPPPKSVSLAEGSITITPQIANDLRTELKEDAPTKIYYVWQQITADLHPIQTTRAVKLTTYSPPVNTYKPLSLPLPAGAKPTQTWRLGLFSPPARTVQGSLETLAQHVCGVWSEGVTVTAPQQKKDRHAIVVKQTRVFREWRLPGDGERQEAPGVLRIVEQTSFDLDKKIWDSGLALSAWLHARMPHSSSISNTLTKSYLDRLLPGSGNVRIVELGAGTGLVSFALGAALRRQEGSVAGMKRYDIYATDLDSAIPLIDENTELNSHLWNTTTNEASVVGPAGAESAELEAKMDVNVHSKVLDWEEDLPSWVHSHGSRVDLVIAADVTYNTASFPALVQTLSALLQPSPPDSQAPLLLLAYKERDPSERELWQMARERGIWMEKVDVITGHEREGAEGTTEIWIGGAGP